ncbi:MAG: aminotransferase family protein [Thermoanaerobaculia bacterium]
MHQHDWQSRQRERLFFTWSVQSHVRGFSVVGGARARFETAEHGWLWDFESQIYNLVAGHRHARIQQRMIEQIGEVPAAHPHALLPIRAELGELLVQFTGMAKAFLTTGGSEAVENAIKIARLYTGRSKIVTRRTSYHGATLAVLGVSGDSRKLPFATSLAPTYHIDDPYPVREAAQGRPSDWLENLSLLVDREGPETIAAILLEGMTGVGGMQTPPADFWPGVRELCDRHGILLIDDEIFSGFGRTGRWWAHEHWLDAPVDILVVGKGLTSGYAPMAGALVTRQIAERFDDEMLYCGLTCFAHPVSCAAAVATIRVIDEEGLVANAGNVGAAMAVRLRELAERVPPIADVRGKGLMQTIVLDRPAWGLHEALLAHGVFAPTSDAMMFLCPPLCLQENEMHDALDRIGAAFASWNGEME